MPSVDDFTVLINESDEWNTLEVPNFSVVITNLIMLEAIPSFLLDVSGNSLIIIVNRQANDPDFLPVRVLLVLYNHLLIVGHRLLTWRAPSRPEVDQYDFTFVVRDILLLTIKVSDPADLLQLIAFVLSTQGVWNFILWLTFTCKFGDFTFKVDTGGVTSPDNLAQLVHERTKWDTTDAPSVGISFSDDKMLRVGHTLLLNVRLDLFGGIVTREPDDSYMLPERVFFMFLEHLMIVVHGVLTWWAPSCPEVNQHDFTNLVLNVAHRVVFDASNADDSLKLVA